MLERLTRAMTLERNQLHNESRIFSLNRSPVMRFRIETFRIIQVNYKINVLGLKKKSQLPICVETVIFFI